MVFAYSKLTNCWERIPVCKGVIYTPKQQHNRQRSLWSWHLKGRKDRIYLVNLSITSCKWQCLSYSLASSFVTFIISVSTSAGTQLLAAIGDYRSLDLHVIAYGSLRSKPVGGKLVILNVHQGMTSYFLIQVDKLLKLVSLDTGRAVPQWWFWELLGGGSPSANSVHAGAQGYPPLIQSSCNQLT